MSSTPTLKVSIITVCKNSDATIKNCIDSVNSQLYKKLEHIVIDGNSTDDTLSVILKNKNVEGPIISEADEGIYDAMNKGLHHATGDLICFLNSDDRYTSNTIIADVVHLIEERHADIVYGDVVYVTPERKTKRYYDSRRFNKFQLKYGLMPAHPSLFARASVYRTVGKFDPRFKIAGDFEMCCRIFQIQYYKSVYLSKPFVEMLVGGASSVSLANLFRVNREIRAACLMNGISTNYFKLLLRYGRKFKEIAVGLIK